MIIEVTGANIDTKERNNTPSVATQDNRDCVAVVQSGPDLLYYDFCLDWLFSFHSFKNFDYMDSSPVLNSINITAQTATFWRPNQNYSVQVIPLIMEVTILLLSELSLQIHGSRPSLEIRSPGGHRKLLLQLHL